MTCVEYVAALSRATKGGGCLGAKTRRRAGLRPRQNPGEEAACPGPLRAAPGVSVEHKDIQ